MAQLVLRDFIYKFSSDLGISQFLNEFSFIKPLAEKWLSQGCLCGMAEEIKKCNQLFNATIDEMIDKDNSLLNEKIKFVFNLEEVEFGLQQNGEYKIKSIK